MAEAVKESIKEALYSHVDEVKPQVVRRVSYAEGAPSKYNYRIKKRRDFSSDTFDNTLIVSSWFLGIYIGNLVPKPHYPSDPKFYGNLSERYIER
jgi:hypothetical protein